MTRLIRSALAAIVCLCAAAASADSAQRTTASLSVVSFGPHGEVQNIAEAKEIRIVFSEPMVSLGAIPDRVRPPYVRISPAIPGTFRWSGTTILIFTPDPKRPLPYATTYRVTIDAAATAVSGRKLAKPVTFSFTTPTVKLLETEWYRRGERYDGRLIVAMRFNQRVRESDVAAHLGAAFTPHEWDLPDLDGLRARLAAANREWLRQFEARVTATRAVAAASGAVRFAPASDWDKKRFPPKGDLVVLEADAVVPPESWITLRLDRRLPSPAGPATPTSNQEYVVKVEQAFFVDHVDCTGGCNPDDSNPVWFRRPVKVTDFARAASARDVTAPAREVALAKPHQPRVRDEYGNTRDIEESLTLEDAGFDAQPPARTYVVTVDGSLKAADGQSLGYTWLGRIENWHRPAFASFGDGHGVWEKDGGPLLPFYARNFRVATQWAAPVRPRDLMPTLRRLVDNAFRDPPAGPGTGRQLGVASDQIQSHGLDISGALGANKTGLVWAAVRPGAATPLTRVYGSDITRATVVQVTNLGITVKDSPLNTLVFVTRLDDGAPVGGADVSIVRLDNTVFWRGKTSADGIAVASNTPLRDRDGYGRFQFIVTAEKDGDVAYVGSDWNEGIEPWEFGTNYNPRQAEPMLRGTIFTDRGVYRLGEEVRFKAVLRQNTPAGVRLLAVGTPIVISVRDGESRVVDTRTVKVNAWSSAEWTMVLPGQGALGGYSVRAVLETDMPKPKAPEALRPGQTPGPRTDEYVPYEKTVYASFLVAAYRRPDFRVDITLGGDALLSGGALNGHISAKYLFGAPLGPRPVKWTYTRGVAYDAPKPIREKFGPSAWDFVGDIDFGEGRYVDSRPLRTDDTNLLRTGTLAITLPTTDSRGVPWVYTLEGDVEDVSRQHIANRASVTVHPAPWYIGLKRIPFFSDQRSGVTTEVVAAGLDGNPVAGVPVELQLVQVQWKSVRRAEGDGFYEWDSERQEIPIGKWTITTADRPVPFTAQLPSGGDFYLTATGRGADGAFAVTRTFFYALGEGYTAWARYDHNRIDLVPERQTWKPGETARVMIKSPWERATALVTTEREGIRTQKPFTLTSTQQSVEIPITEADIPNVFVSVLLIKGRTKAATSAQDTSDPGKPSFRLGYTELKVEDGAKRLTLELAANKQEYRPANAARIDLQVNDRQGRGVPSEVTLWAVDYGVLSLTGYRTPDVLASVYVQKALQVMNQDSRQRIISRRVLTPKGDTDGGGGGAEGGVNGGVRKDFRVLAFWVGSLATDASGHATTEVTLPESLTTYRIMAVAADRNSRFGSADREIRINKPVTLKPTWPRFLAVGDTAHFGAVVTSQLPSAGTAAVTLKSLDPSVLDVGPAATASLPIAAGGSVEARFQASAKSIGRARIRMTVAVGSETDAFEDVIPVEVLASPETVAAYGQTGDSTPAVEKLTIPAGVIAGFGGLHVEMASTAMVGLGEGARYLVEYPYGCAEQKGSRALALLLAADLGDAFTLPGMDTSKMRPAVQQTLDELRAYQCASGGFAYWPGSCSSVSPYLTAYLLHVFKTAADFKYTVDPSMRERAYAYLDAKLGEASPANEGWWPSYTAWQAFAVKVLAEGGRNEDSNINRLYGHRDRMPVFALAYLHDAMLAKGETSGPRVVDLRRRMNNAILPEAGSAHVEELSDPYLLWFWNSNVRSTAIVLNSLIRGGITDEEARPIVRWMMQVRKDGRWGNTQENAHAMESLVAYYRKFESVVPDFTAVVKLSEREIARQKFAGRTTTSVSKDVAMPEVLAGGAAGSSSPLTFTREGAGSLFYSARLRYAADTVFHKGLDTGFSIERSYAPYVENGIRPATTSYKAGDLVRVTLTLRLTKERRFVAVTDPLPAGFEPVESWFATTARTLAQDQDQQPESNADWNAWWQRGGFDHVERHDDRVQLFATRLSEGRHTFSYIVRATTAGTFRTAPAHAEEMYEPEVFGRTATAIVEVRK